MAHFAYLQCSIHIHGLSHFMYLRITLDPNQHTRKSMKQNYSGLINNKEFRVLTKPTVAAAAEAATPNSGSSSSSSNLAGIYLT